MKKQLALSSDIDDRIPPGKFFLTFFSVALASILLMAILAGSVLALAWPR